MRRCLFSLLDPPRWDDDPDGSYDVVCLFVNDVADGEVLKALGVFGVRMVALRCDVTGILFGVDCGVGAGRCWSQQQRGPSADEDETEIVGVGGTVRLPRSDFCGVSRP